MPTSRVVVADIPWRELPEAHGMMTKVLAELPEESLTIRVNRVPTEGMPEGKHATPHIMFVLKGQGRLWVEDAGDVELGPSIFVYVPPNLRHSITNVKDLEILTVSIKAKS